MDNQQVAKADSKFQKIARKNHRKWKLRLLSKGGQKADTGGSPYNKKPDYNRAKSAPPGFGGSLEEVEQLDEIIRKKDGKYCLFSKKTKRNLGCYPTRAGAVKREKQVQYFKHLKESGASEMERDIKEEIRKILEEEGIIDKLTSFLGLGDEKPSEEKPETGKEEDKIKIDAERKAKEKESLEKTALLYGHSQTGGIGLALKRALESKGYKVKLIIKNGANDSRLLSEVGEAGDPQQYSKVFIFAGGNYPKVPRVPEISSMIQHFGPQKTTLILPPINIDEEVAKNIVSRNESNRSGIINKFGGVVKVYIPAGTTKDFSPDGIHMKANSAASANLSSKIVSELDSVSAKPRSFIDDLKNSITSSDLYKAVVDFGREQLAKYVSPVTAQEYPKKEEGKKYSKVSYYKDPEFSEELNRVAKKYDIDPLDLLAVMHIESGVDSTRVNSSSRATGLIQFMPSTARKLGTSVEELSNMTNAEQMKYVDKFFDMMNLRKGASGPEIYATVFLPARRYRDVLTTSDEKYYKPNRGLDVDKDGDIDQSDISTFVSKHKNMVRSRMSESKKIVIKFGQVLEESKKKKGKEDRCVRIAKSKYDAWPSAYASGAVVKCRQGKIWKDIKEEEELEEEWSRSERSKRKSKCSNPKGFTMKQFCKNQRTRSKAGQKTNEGSDPKEGTGKKPKGSGRRLYTDENPKDTVSVKFSTAEDIRDTLSKESFKSKSHARQSQIINLIHQRVRAAHENAKDPETKARLRIALDYAEKRKEASKKKTASLQKEEVLTEKCWPGYTQKGMKTMFGKKYPNCVKKTNEEIELEERKLGKPSSETSLRDWFKRKGAPGKRGGWVDCNTCRDGKCSPCGRQGGEKRSKYPRCRPTPAQCKGYKRRGDNLQKEEEQ